MEECLLGHFLSFYPPFLSIIFLGQIILKNGDDGA